MLAGVMQNLDDLEDTLQKMTDDHPPDSVEFLTVP